MYTKEEYLAHFVSVEELEKSIQHVKDSIFDLKKPVNDRVLELIKYIRRRDKREDDHYYQLRNLYVGAEKDKVYLEFEIHIPRYGDDRYEWHITVDEFCDPDFIPRLIREEGKLF